MSLLDPRLWLAVLLFVLAAGWVGYHVGDEEGAERVQAKWDRATIQQIETARRIDAENRTIEFNRMEIANGSQERARIRMAGSLSRHRAADTAADGLRDDRATAAAAADLPGQSADACRRYAATLDALLGDVEAEGRGMAKAAEGHASDSLMLQEAWPTNAAAPRAERP